MLFHSSVGTRMVQVPIMQVIDMPIVLNRRVSAVLAMNMVVMVVNLLRHRKTLLALR
jgi:hypothetical protein